MSDIIKGLKDALRHARGEEIKGATSRVVSVEFVEPTPMLPYPYQKEEPVTSGTITYPLPPKSEPNLGASTVFRNVDPKDSRIAELEQALREAQEYLGIVKLEYPTSNVGLLCNRIDKLLSTKGMKTDE